MWAINRDRDREREEAIKRDRRLRVIRNLPRNPKARKVPR